MFLRERATQEEYCDQPDLPDADIASNYHHLSRFNRVMFVADPFQRLLVRWLGRAHVASLTFLDLGAGDASLAPRIERWAARRGWTWKVTSLDSSPRALRLGPGSRRIAADVCALPFAENTFDVVMASQMTHHLTDEETVTHFREAWRVTRDVLFLTDAHRNVGALAVLWMVLRVLRVPRRFLSDGMLSVRRGWRVAEWRNLARRAAIPNSRVSVYYGSRIFLRARKGRAG
jgi:2-polyprenyl-3-methyl-5-hydroxy-6-metoxy-1,4-benzoquinol methylase